MFEKFDNNFTKFKNWFVYRILRNLLRAIYQLLLLDLPDKSRHSYVIRTHAGCVIHYNEAFQLKNGIKNEKDYLCTAADLAIKYNMGYYLRDIAFGQEYTVGELVNVIGSQIKVEPQIFVIHHSGKMYLNQIYLYLDSDLKLIDTKRKQNYDDIVIYTPCDGFALAPPKHTE